MDHLSIAVIATPTQNKNQNLKRHNGCQQILYKSTENGTETKIETNPETKSRSKIRIKINQAHRERLRETWKNTGSNLEKRQRRRAVTDAGSTRRGDVVTRPHSLLQPPIPSRPRDTQSRHHCEHHKTTPYTTGRSPRHLRLPSSLSLSLSLSHSLCVRSNAVINARE